ncbi:MAG TPA: DUF899 domain-containing protein [Longimicrobium sp.]|nr:DUF899 domain-containing protein [Longimicrobium sp.]
MTTETAAASLPPVVSRDEWLAARTALLAREKELTRLRDALVADRRRLPMVEVEKDYVFGGPEGRVGLRDLFGERHQLIVAHFMFHPDWDAGCPSCTAGADEVADGLRRHLEARDTRLVYVSRAPLAKLEAYRAQKGWTFPWYSSHGSDFNYDYGVTLDESVAPVVCNYRTKEEYERRGEPFASDAEEGALERPGRSAFLRVGDTVYHTYSVYARGLESMGGSYYLLDETALGRQEAWEEPKGRAAAARDAVPDFAE